MRKARKPFVRKGIFHVYILRCNDDTYYTGYTSDLDKRVKQHNLGTKGAKYVKGKTPAKLVYAKEYKYYKLAVSEERRIKKLKRSQKEELINGQGKKTKNRH